MIFPNFVFSHDGHFGVGRAGGGETYLKSVDWDIGAGRGRGGGGLPLFRWCTAILTFPWVWGSTLPYPQRSHRISGADVEGGGGVPLRGGGGPSFRASYASVGPLRFQSPPPPPPLATVHCSSAAAVACPLMGLRPSVALLVKRKDTGRDCVPCQRQMALGSGSGGPL